MCGQKVWSCSHSLQKFFTLVKSLVVLYLLLCDTILHVQEPSYRYRFYLFRYSQQSSDFLSDTELNMQEIIGTGVLDYLVILQHEAYRNQMEKSIQKLNGEKHLSYEYINSVTIQNFSNLKKRQSPYIKNCQIRKCNRNAGKNIH